MATSKVSKVKGRDGPKRVQNKTMKTRTELINNITKGDIRRIARRGGVRRLSTGIYPCARDILLSWVQDVVKDSMVFMEHAKRTTVFASDVIYALKRKGQNMYGCEVY